MDKVHIMSLSEHNERGKGGVENGTKKGTDRRRKKRSCHEV